MGKSLLNLTLKYCIDNVLTLSLHLIYNINIFPTQQLMTTVQVRTDDKLKKEVQSVLKELGLDMSSAINMYFRQIVILQGIPFKLRTVNGFTPEQERKMIRETEEAIKYGKRYDSVDEMVDDILND